MERLDRDKRSYLLRKLFNYRQKSFITLGPGEQNPWGSTCFLSCSRRGRSFCLPCPSPTEKRNCWSWKIKSSRVLIHPGVNFTNILWAAFAAKSFCQKLPTQMYAQKSCVKNFCTKKLLVKYWWNWHLEVQKKLQGIYLSSYGLGSHVSSVALV